MEYAGIYLEEKEEGIHKKYAKFRIVVSIYIDNNWHVG